MDVIITKYIGIRGTALIARSKKEELLLRYPEWLVKEASLFDDELNYESAYENGERIDILKEVYLAKESGAIYAEEYTEFGVFEALFQMSKALKCGLRINIKDIPIKQETVEVCEYVGCNPYALYSGYSAVIVSSEGQKLVDFLESNNIPVKIVGTTTEDNDKILINDDEQSFLPHIRKDELKNVLGRKEYHERTNSGNT